MTGHMASLIPLSKKTRDVMFVSISVNPENDTPEILAAYRKKMNVDTPQWLFLTGQRDAIQKLALNSFKLGSLDEPIFHSSYFTLVDRNGKIRGYYDGTKQSEMQRLRDEVALLQKEQP
jgi:protein SCO1/2